MYPNGQPAGFFPRSSSLNSMAEVMVPLTGVVQGNTEAMQPSLVAFPSVGASHYMPAQFLCRQSSQELQAPCTQNSGYQQQPIQAWHHYNHYNNTPPATLQYPPPQQAMMYNVGGEREATPKARKPPLKRKSIDYTVDKTPFHGSNIRHHIMLNKQVQWPRLIYETRCTKSPNAQQSGEKSNGGKINSTSSEQISSMLFMPTHRPRSPKKRPWKGERKVRFIPKKPTKKRRNRSVERVLKSCAKKLRESSMEEVSDLRPKRASSISVKKETLVKDIPPKLKMPMSLGYSQTPPESSDEDSDEVETENVAQPVDSKVDPKNPNGRAANGLELAPKKSSISMCTKPVLAPTLPKSYRPEIMLEKPAKLFTFPPKLPLVATQQVNKAEIRLDSKKIQTTFTEEQDVLSVKSSLASPKEHTPTAHHASSDITTPGSSCRLAGMKPPIPYTPPTEKIIKPKPKPTPKPTVPPLKRHNWSPAPRVSDFNNLPLIIERTVKDDPWQTVRRRKHGSIPEVRLSAPSPELIQSPPPSKEVLHSKEPKKPRKRRRRKKTRAPESAKVESIPSTTAPEEPLAQAPSKRKSRCDLFMDCLQRTFPFWRKDKTN